MPPQRGRACQLRCTAGLGLALLPLPPLHRVTFRCSLCRKVRFSETLGSSHLLLWSRPHRAGMSKNHPPSSPVRALCPSAQSCPSGQQSSRPLSLHGLPDFMSVPTAFICHQLLLILAHQLSAPVTWFPVRPPCPACCHSELKFKACSRPWTGQWFSVPVEQETTWQGYQNPAVLG